MLEGSLRSLDRRDREAIGRISPRILHHIEADARPTVTHTLEPHLRLVDDIGRIVIEVRLILVWMSLAGERQSAVLEQHSMGNTKGWRTDGRRTDVGNPSLEFGVAADLIEQEAEVHIALIGVVDSAASEVREADVATMIRDKRQLDSPEFDFNMDERFYESVNANHREGAVSLAAKSAV